MRRLLLALLLFSVIGSAAFTKSYSYTVGASVVTSGPHTDFPIVINVTDAGLKSTGNGGVVTDAQGDDINFFSDSGLTTLLKWKMTWNASTGNLVAWVKISSLANNGVIYIGAGDAAITTFQGDSVNVWNSNFMAVYALPDGSTLSFADSTTNARNGTGLNTPTATTGKVDGGMQLTSTSSQAVSLGSWFLPTAATVTAWVYADSFPNTLQAIFTKQLDAFNFYVLYVRSDGKLAGHVYGIPSGYTGYDGTGSVTLSTGTWYKITMSYDSSGGLNVYVNSTLDKNLTAVGNLTTDGGGSSWVGGDSADANRYWNGKIDELFVSNIARSSGWITTEYTNQNDPSAFGTLLDITPAATRRIYVID